MSSQSNKSLIDGFACLNEITKSPIPLGCRELARQLNLETTRVNRLLMTFETQGILTKTSKKKYLPGPGLFVLSAQSLQTSHLLKNILKIIEEIPEDDYVFAVGFLYQKHVSYLFHGKPGQGIAAGLHFTKAYYAIDSSIGQILLAQKSAEELQSLFTKEENELYHFTPDIQKKIKKQGYVSLIRNKNKESYYSTAIMLPNYPFAGIAITNVPTSTPEKKLVDLLKQIAQKIPPL